MTEEVLRDIRSRYPGITEEELQSLSPEEWNKCSIALLEGIAKDYKDMLQEFFKNHKSWISGGISEENIEWYKEFLREGKNSAESMLKDRVLEQQYLRGGLNPPWCNKHNRD